MVEEKIEFEILPADFEGNLTPDEGKAGAQFEEASGDTQNRP